MPTQTCASCNGTWQEQLPAPLHQETGLKPSTWNRAHLCGIEGHVQALGPVQLDSQLLRRPSLAQDIVQGAPCTELCHHAWRLQADTHEQNNVGVANG